MHASTSGRTPPKANVARFFVEHRQISWLLLLAVLAWGAYGYFRMPQRKDPDIPVKTAVAITNWPGASADKVEQLVTRKIEETIARNAKVEKVWSISRTGTSLVYVSLDKVVPKGQVGKEFDDIKLRLDGISDLPDGAGPIHFIKDFGDTAALMLTVASPNCDAAELGVRAKEIAAAITNVRTAERDSRPRTAVVFNYPATVDKSLTAEPIRQFAKFLEADQAGGPFTPLFGPGFAGVDGRTGLTATELRDRVRRFFAECLPAADLPPDAWEAAIISTPTDTEAVLRQVAGDKYGYRDLDGFTELIEKTLKALPDAAKVTRSGLLREQINLLYSQERLAAYGLDVASIGNRLNARNISAVGGQIETGGKNLMIEPTGEYRSETDIGDTMIATSANGNPVYLRDLVDVSRGYESPQRFLNFFTWRDTAGQWHRTRAVTLAVQMKEGRYISAFGKEIDRALDQVRRQLPSDLVFARTSDQPVQVAENVDLFMGSLYEAVVLVVLVSLIGFWDWRTAILIAAAIPITLAMTFGMAHTLGIDLQQISIASLIIALGLLVDVPVVAGDGIKHALGDGTPPLVAAWKGPTNLLTAIIFATLTNVVAYLPFLLLPGDTGEFLYSLPVVLTCSLLSAMIVSVTFVPFLGYYLLKPKPEKTVAERKATGFAKRYFELGRWLIEHRRIALVASALIPIVGFGLGSRLKTDFFPKDHSYLCYLDVWLPEDAPLAATGETAAKVEQVVRDVAEAFGTRHPDPSGRPRQVLRSVTTFVGGGGPRFWFSVSPELMQLNYAQVLLQVADKHDTEALIAPLQEALDTRIPGARIDVRQLDTGTPIPMPVEIRITGEDIAALRATAENVKAVLRDVPTARRVRDDWGEATLTLNVATDPDRANLAGVTNLDVALSTATGISGGVLTTLRERDKQIPVTARLRLEDRSQLANLKSLYVYSGQSERKIPIGQVADLQPAFRDEKIRRRNQFRTITVGCLPAPGVLPSEIMAAARENLAAIPLSPGISIEIGGTEEEQVKGFSDLTRVLAISVLATFLVLAFQFRNAVKPIIVFAAVPYGVAGALAVLWLMGTPFGFMAFLGVISLIGLIISHIIVLFDFVEEMRQAGEGLVDALLGAGIMRLRPVLITVLALILALIPLALHGGPLWEPMCFAVIGGMALATFITLLLVPVFYSIAVLDLKVVRWE